MVRSGEGRGKEWIGVERGVVRSGEGHGKEWIGVVVRSGEGCG